MSAVRARASVAAQAIAAALLLASCSVIPTAPSELPEEWVRSVEPSAIPPDQVDSPVGFTLGERAAVRIRNVNCDGLLTGSGFILDEHTIVTNHHVIEAAGLLEVTLSDGTDITVTSSSYSTEGDLGFIKTVEVLEPAVTLASADPDEGEEITILGYPHGDALTVASGTVLASGEDTLSNAPTVWSTSAEVAPGSSGSAVYDTETGSVIGVLYAGDTELRESYLIPVSLLTEFLSDPALQVANPAGCAPE